jgi:hypothetical protein
MREARMGKLRTGTIMVVVGALVVPAAASGAAKTSYEGQFTGHATSTFSFEVVKKRKKGKVRRTIRNVEFTNMPVFCDSGQLSSSNGSVPLVAKVSKDDRFAGTGYREYAQGFINLAHLRGEFRQNRTLAAGVFSNISRGINQQGFIDCSSGFLDWAAEKVP